MTTHTHHSRHAARSARAPVMLALAIALGGAWGCATPQEPEMLRRASSQLKQEQTEEIQSLQPRLLREARAYEQQARDAHARGQLDRANLLAHRAVQSYETARLLMERHASERLTGLMKRADDELDARLAEVKRQQEELRRFRELESSQSAASPASNSPKAAAARRAVTDARQRQLAAISEGAPTAAPQRYNQGRMYVELAVESLGRGAFDEAQAHASAAIKRLDQAVATAKEQAAPAPSTAPARTAAPAAETTPAARLTADVRPTPADGDPLKARAAEALQSAATARKLAVQRGADTAALREGDASLERAQQATQRGDHIETIERAAEARARFTDAKAPAVAPGTTPSASPATAAAPTAQVSAATTAQATPRQDAVRERVARQLIDLQVRRADALSRQLDTSCAGPFKAFESLLGAARERASAGDDAGALELGVRASITLDGCASDDDARNDRGARSRPATKREREEEAKAARARDAAAERIAEAQRLMASASARMSGDARLKEPAMLITQAERWFGQGVWGQAETLATSARDRLKAILDSPPPTPSPTSSTRGVTGKPDASAQRTSASAAAKQGAGEAASCEPMRMAMVRVEIARADADKRPLTADLRADRARADRLVKTAETLAKQGQCQPAVQLADESAAMLTELARRAELKAQADKKAEAEAKPAVAARTATPVTKTTADANTARIDQVDKKLDATSARVDEANRKLDTIKQGDGDAKKTSVNVVVTPPVGSTGDKTDNKADAKKPSEAQLAAAREAIAAARLTRARAEGQRASEVYRTADALLTEADQQLTRGQPDAAARLAKQADNAFASLVKPPAKADDPARQPAYAKLLDAQIVRDRAAQDTGDAEAAILKLGESNLKRAQDAWGREDYVATGRFADAAKADFERAVAAAGTRRLAESKQAQDARAAEAERARQAQAARERQAQTERVKQRADAEDALREARIQKRKCDDADCPRRDSDSTIRAAMTLTSAQESFTRGDYPRSALLAGQARDLYLSALKRPLPFTLPSGITRVKRVNDRLLLTPKLSFLSGRAQLTADSAKTVQELARVLVTNAPLLEKVELLGFTDSRGKRDANVKLSDERALTVRDALVKLGVDTALMEARGLGPERPVADNSTPQGREANRRVEVHLTFKP